MISRPTRSLISFLRNRKKYRKALVKGRMYVDANTFALIKLEDYQDNSHISYKPHHGNKRFHHNHRELYYHKIGDKYHLKYMKIKYHSHHENINTGKITSSYNSDNEFVITNIEKVSDNPIPEDQRLKYKNHLKQLQVNTEYTDDFWENYNVLTSLDFKTLLVLDSTQLPKQQSYSVAKKPMNISAMVLTLLRE